LAKQKKKKKKEEKEKKKLQNDKNFKNFCPTCGFEPHLLDFVVFFVLSREPVFSGGQKQLKADCF
jgi:hypothetical protein